jgi:hypothetical protein
LQSWRRKSAKVSGLDREYSRFAETIGGDWFDHDCYGEVGPEQELPVSAPAAGTTEQPRPGWWRRISKFWSYKKL